MTLRYDHSFAPYVIPDGGLLDGALVPHPRWAAKMALTQLQSQIGAAAIRLAENGLGGRLTRGARAKVAKALQAIVPEAAGGISTQGDAEFAYARFAGMHPLLIERVDDVSLLPEQLRLSDEKVGEITGGGSGLAARAKAGDLFMVNYDMLRVGDLENLQEGKFVAPACALFCHAPELESRFPVVPLAIACPSSRADGHAETVTPLDGPRWHAAKQVVGVADVHAAELTLHLTRAHYMTVPFAIALRRVVPKNHPLYRFLFPHLRFDVFVDRQAWLRGIKETAGVLVRSLGGSARWSQDVARTLYYKYSFREQHFERDLEARGMATHPVDYPYRDDGRLLWGAIRCFVSDFVDLTWPSDAMVATDEHLQQFVADVTDPNGGNVRGMLAGDRLDTRDELIEILTQIIFVAGPLHAVAHYTSAAQLQHVERNPSWLTANPVAAPGHGALRTVEGLNQYTRVVGGNCRFGTLGDFSDVPFGKLSEYRPIIERFQSALMDIESEISRRNQSRLIPYLHLLPSRIPNGTTV